MPIMDDSSIHLLSIMKSREGGEVIMKIKLNVRAGGGKNRSASGV
jgi:hypothetical protein